MYGEHELIRAGKTEEAKPGTGEWAFVDPGFSNRSKSCGFLVGNGKPEELQFAKLRAKLVHLACSGSEPLNLVIEAPLSVSFDALGNPTGRSVDRRGSQARLWYVGLGCGVLVSATYLLRALWDSPVSRKVRLFEAFVSFKERGVRSSHKQDVLDMRCVVWGDKEAGQVVAPEKLQVLDNDRLESAFRVAGMDCGIPPVVVVGGADKGVQDAQG